MLGILPLFLVFFRGDFPICQAANDQECPIVLFVNDQYYVFWRDLRGYEPNIALCGARLDTSGTVLDTDGKLLFSNVVAQPLKAAHDGTNFLVVLRDSC